MKNKYLAERLLGHVGHTIECVTYGWPIVNVAIECIDCGMVLVDYDVKEESNDDREAE